MKSTLFRSELQTRLERTYANPQELLAMMDDPALPDDLAAWLSRLGLLYGVPFNYLVPDEKMLPPESIRFFYLDNIWVSALINGAFSIGRNLSAETSNASHNLDAAVGQAAMQKVNTFKPKIRAKKLGIEVPDPPKIISGFVLRSSVVLDYPSMGVNVFGSTPDNPNQHKLDIVRMEQLGPKSDTLICLVSGDVQHVDIHEAPQALHYGIDCYDDKCEVKQAPALAVKNLHTFTATTKTDPVTGTKEQVITMSEKEKPTDISASFRKSSRVIDITTLAGIIAKTNAPEPTPIDSAIMGFEMTEGVGLVSFLKR
jgi:hypothetical protein